MPTMTVERPRGMRSITEQAVFLSIHFEAFGNTRHVASSRVEVDADKRRINVTKRLLDSEELKSISRLDADVLSYIDSKCLPYEKGLHVLPIGLVGQVEAKLQEFSERRELMAESFTEKYPELLETAREPLGVLFERADYPTQEQVRARFRMTWNYVTLSTPASLKELSADLFEKERDKIQQKMQDSYEEWRTMLRVGMADLVERLKDSLVPGADGKTKRLTDSSVNRLREFLNTFEFRNVTDDTELAIVSGQLKDLMQGITPEQLRESETLKERTGLIIKEASETLNTMTAGIRKLRSDD